MLPPTDQRGTPSSRSSSSSSYSRRYKATADLSYTTASTLGSNEPLSFDRRIFPSSSRRPAEDKESSSLCITKCFSFLDRRVVQEEEADDRNTNVMQNTTPAVSSSKCGQSRSSFSLKEIAASTGNFSRSNIIGEGNFGVVYKGVLKDGTAVAVKCAKKKGVYGASTQVPLEFQNEVFTLSQVDHINLVRFYGYVENNINGEAMIVSEFVSNGNLRQHLTTGTTSSGCLGMAERLQIAMDVSSAISYLHNYTDRPIIHRDIKATNILIDENYRAKVTDFGFARLVDDTQFRTFITTRVKGTEGYLDPEYFKTYRLTKKSDVYSFGVLIVELVTGKPPMDYRNYKQATGKNKTNNTELALKEYRAGNLTKVMDAGLGREKASMVTAEEMLQLAMQCLELSSSARPSVKECSERLWNIRTQFQRLSQQASTASSCGSKLPVKSRVSCSSSSTAGDVSMSFSVPSSWGNTTGRESQGKSGNGSTTADGSHQQQHKNASHDSRNDNYYYRCCIL